MKYFISKICTQFKSYISTRMAKCQMTKGFPYHKQQEQHLILYLIPYLLLVLPLIFTLGVSSVQKLQQYSAAQPLEPSTVQWPVAWCTVLYSGLVYCTVQWPLYCGVFRGQPGLDTPPPSPAQPAPASQSQSQGHNTNFGDGYGGFLVMLHEADMRLLQVLNVLQLA